MTNFFVKISTKKIAGLFFLVPGFMPLLFILSFSIQQQIVRHQMKERLEKELLQNITLADKDVHWVKKGKEILIEGRMFDIETTRHHNDSTTFSGLYDDDETLLMLQMNENWNENSLGDDHFLTQLFESLQNVFYNQSSDLNLVSAKQSNLFDPFYSNLLNQFKTVPTHPPQG